MSTVAILGVGRMGAAMARRLDAAGHDVVLWNRTRATADELAAELTAVTVADDAAGAVARAHVVLAVLASGVVTEQVLLDETLVAAVPEGTVVVDMGTSGAATARRLAAAFDARRVLFVDAPVSGSVATVEAGQLLVMASGDEAAVDSMAGVVDAFAKRVVHLGEAGAGQAMKLGVNLVVHGLNAILSEALALAEAAGIEPSTAYDVLEDSVVAAPFVAYKRQAFLEEDAPVAFTLDLVEKDLSLITSLASTLGVPVTVTDAVDAAVQGANERGRGSHDMADLRADIVARTGTDRSD